MDVGTGPRTGLRERRIPVEVSAVIPALNEERNIGWVLERLPTSVDEVIVVDGRSTDDTIFAALCSRPDARIVQERAPGKGAALRAGFEAANGDVVVMLDADGSMHPREIDRFLAAIDEGFDLVKGSRFLPEGGTTDISRLRAAGNFALLGLANTLYRRAAEAAPQRGRLRDRDADRHARAARRPARRGGPELRGRPPLRRLQPAHVP